jgi:hypothetical protein
LTHGLDHFKEAFIDLNDQYVVVGGMAAATLMEDAGIEFRVTKDIDLVIIASDTDAIAEKLIQYVTDGKYTVKEKNADKPVYYRFTKPELPEYPFQVEIFHRKPDGVELLDDQHIVPIKNSSSGGGLSAILLEDEYFELIRDNSVLEGGLPIASTLAVIALKARAYNDLKSRKDAGEPIDSREIKKHLRDIFRLTQTLTGEETLQISGLPKQHLTKFLSETESLDPQILKQLFASLKIPLTPADSISLLKTTFKIDEN